MLRNPEYSGLKGIEEIDGKLQAVFNLATPVSRRVFDTAGNSRSKRATTDNYTRLELIALIAETRSEGGDVTLLRQGLQKLESARASGMSPK